MISPLRSWWRRRAGVRVRTALTAALAVGVVLAFGSLLFIVLLTRSLAGAVDDSLMQQAQTLANSLHRSGTAGVDLRGRVGGSNLVQVLGPDGAVLVSSSELASSDALVDLLPPPGRHRTVTTQIASDADADYRILSLGLTSPDGSREAVVVAQSLDSVQDSTAKVGALLLVGSPVLLVLTALLTYWLSGRALRPVETMRRQVDDIDARTLHARVPLPEAHDEVWRLAGTMNHMLDRLDAAAAAQRRFVSDASHELRSPLAALRTTVEVAQAHPANANVVRTQEIVLEEALRLERLVGDLLLLARADEQGLQLHHEDVDLDDILAAERDRLRDSGEILVTADIAPVRVVGDVYALSRAVRNLVDNACRHATSAVQLRVFVKGEWACIEVADDGPGIPVAEHERVFERFVRLDDSRTRSAGGTGLGLAIVRQIAHAHGGEVTAVDGAGGTRIRLTFPLQGTLRPAVAT